MATSSPKDTGHARPLLAPCCLMMAPHAGSVTRLHATASMQTRCFASPALRSPSLPQTSVRPTTPSPMMMAAGATRQGRTLIWPNQPGRRSVFIKVASSPSCTKGIYALLTSSKVSSESSEPHNLSFFYVTATHMQQLARSSPWMSRPLIPKSGYLWHAIGVLTGTRLRTSLARCSPSD